MRDYSAIDRNGLEGLLIHRTQNSHVNSLSIWCNIMLLLFFISNVGTASTEEDNWQHQCCRNAITNYFSIWYLPYSLVYKHMKLFWKIVGEMLASVCKYSSRVYHCCYLQHSTIGLLANVALEMMYMAASFQWLKQNLSASSLFRIWIGPHILRTSAKKMLCVSASS